MSDEAKDYINNVLDEKRADDRLKRGESHGQTHSLTHMFSAC